MANEDEAKASESRRLRAAARFIVTTLMCINRASTAEALLFLLEPELMAQPADFGFRIADFGLLSDAMPQFAYRARNAQGGLVEGVLNCADRAVAIRQIEMQQCIPIKIEAVGAL